MAVKLEGSIRRYIGLSTDTKPFVGTQFDTAGTVVTAADLPAGSSFFETDTWRIARFDGVDWKYEPDRSEVAGLLAEILSVLREQQETLKLIAESL